MKHFLPFAILYLASCSDEVQSASWEGVDNSTAFHLCAVSVPPLPGGAATVFSLVVAPSFGTPWLMRVTADDSAVFELSTRNDPVEFDWTVQVSKQLSVRETSHFEKTLEKTGIFDERPVDSLAIEDGTFLGFEHAAQGKYIAFGSNANQQVEEIHRVFLSLCGEDCDYRWSIPHTPEYTRPFEHCVPILHDEDDSLSVFQASRVDNLLPTR